MVTKVLVEGKGIIARRCPCLPTGRRRKPKCKAMSGPARRVMLGPGEKNPGYPIRWILAYFNKYFRVLFSYM
jgi:hypothetical protein